MILAQHGYFLRVFELKNKFCHLTLKDPKKQNIVSRLSSCLNKKYNGFHVVSIKYSKKLRKKLEPINIVYKPIKSPENKIQCYFSSDITKSYRNSCGDSKKKSGGFAFECYDCRRFFARADKQKRRIQNCSSIRGIVYNFNNKILIIFEDNFKSKDDIPMRI